MTTDYATIRTENKCRYGTDIGASDLADRYDDRTHFIFELLQNAEDALARRTVGTATAGTASWKVTGQSVFEEEVEPRGA